MTKAFRPSVVVFLRKAQTTVKVVEIKIIEIKNHDGETPLISSATTACSK
jgi:hypothetical protein